MWNKKPNMIKKIWWIFLFCLINISVITHAQGAIGDVDISFCDTTEKAMAYKIQPWEKIDLCYNIQNKINSDVTVKIWFIDGTFTNDERKNRACELDQAITFWQYVTGYEETIIIPASWTVQKTAQIIFPSEKIWLVPGCLVYSVVENPSDKKADEASNFSIQIRKAKFIDVSIGDIQEAIKHINEVSKASFAFGTFTPTDGVNLSSDPKIRIWQDSNDNKYIVAVKLINPGIADEEIILTGVATDMLTYKNTFAINGAIAKWNTWGTILQYKLTEIPNLKLNIKFDVAHTPLFDQTTKGETNSLAPIQTSIIIMNIITEIIGWILILIIFLIIFLIIRHHKKKKDTTQSQIPTPQIPSPQIPTTPTS